MLASGSTDGSVYIWDMASGSVKHILAGHTGAIRTLTFSLNGDILFSSSADNTVRMWRVSSGSSLQALKAVGIANSVAISPDGTLLAVGSEDGIVRLWGVMP